MSPETRATLPFYTIVSMTAVFVVVVASGALPTSSLGPILGFGVTFAIFAWVYRLNVMLEAVGELPRAVATTPSPAEAREQVWIDIMVKRYLDGEITVAEYESRVEWILRGEYDVPGASVPGGGYPSFGPGWTRTDTRFR